MLKLFRIFTTYELIVYKNKEPERKEKTQASRPRPKEKIVNNH